MRPRNAASSLSRVAVPVRPLPEPVGVGLGAGVAVRVAVGVGDGDGERLGCGVRVGVEFCMDGSELTGFAVTVPFELSVFAVFCDPHELISADA